MKGGDNMNIGYVRCAHKNSIQNDCSLEQQRLSIKQFAQDNDIIIDHWYEDDGISGITVNRPGLYQLMQDLDNDIQNIIITDFARLGRSFTQTQTLLKEFQLRNIQLISIADNNNSMQQNDTFTDNSIGIITDILLDKQ